MEVVFLHAVSVILIVTCGCGSTAFYIDRSVCLESVIKVMLDPKNCNFSRKYAVGLLEDRNVICQTKCRVIIMDMHSIDNLLNNVYITVGSTNYKYYPCDWSFDGRGLYELNMDVNCPALNEVKIPIGGYCKLDEQCQGNDYSGVCHQGRCVCGAGYILFNLQCHEGNLPLNNTCSFSEQCAGSPYASCRGGNCSCIEGYTAENYTNCIQDQKITLPSSVVHHQEEAKIGHTLGALFGGLLLGVILTTAAVIIYSRSKNHGNKREDIIVTFADNEAYSSAKVVDQSVFQNIQKNDKKREIYPFSEETPIYNNVYGKPRDGQTQDTVYNHLHEQVKPDDADYYDHACAASTHSRDMDDYSHLRNATS